MFIRTTILALLLAGTVHAQGHKGESSRDRPATEQEELALAALEGLMAQPSDRALPILKKVLAGPQSTLIKRRALFVLSQIESPESREILLQTARSSNPELRAEAIRSMGIEGDPKSLDALQEIYKTGDAETRSNVLQAWLIADHTSAVYNVAVNARSEDEAAEAIRMLGVMGATEELRKLGDKPNSSRGLIEAYAMAGDLEGLLKIVNGTGPHAQKVDAAQRIGMVDGEAARKALRDIYTRSTDAEMKDAALHGMLIADDDQGVLALYRAAKSSDEKRALLRTLSRMDSDAALEAIDATLEKTP